jgi:serine/threonine-protein kinase HipA
MNPVPGSKGLCLNIDQSGNALDLDLVRSVAPYFRDKNAPAVSIIDRISDVVRDWSDITNALGINRSEQADMTDAFVLRQST